MRNVALISVLVDMRQIAYGDNDFGAAERAFPTNSSRKPTTDEAIEASRRTVLRKESTQILRASFARDFEAMKEMMRESDMPHQARLQFIERRMPMW